MRILGNPLGADDRVVSGESGAVTAGLLAILLRAHCLAKARDYLGLNENAHVLLISTEGDTDPAAYRRIVWDGAVPAPNPFDWQ